MAFYEENKDYVNVALKRSSINISYEQINSICQTLNKIKSAVTSLTPPKSFTGGANVTNYASKSDETVASLQQLKGAIEDKVKEFEQLVIKHKREVLARKTPEDLVKELHIDINDARRKIEEMRNMTDEELAASLYINEPQATITSYNPTVLQQTIGAAEALLVHAGQGLANGVSGYLASAYTAVGTLTGSVMGLFNSRKANEIYANTSAMVKSITSLNAYESINPNSKAFMDLNTPGWVQEGSILSQFVTRTVEFETSLNNPFLRGIEQAGANTGKKLNEGYDLNTAAKFAGLVGGLEGLQMYVGTQLSEIKLTGSQRLGRIGVNTAFNILDVPTRAVIDSTTTGSKFVDSFNSYGGVGGMLTSGTFAMVGSLFGEALDMLGNRVKSDTKSVEKLDDSMVGTGRLRSKDEMFGNIKGEKVVIYRGSKGEGFVEVDVPNQYEVYDGVVVKVEADDYYCPPNAVVAKKFNSSNFDDMPADAQRGLQLLESRGGELPEGTTIYFVRNKKELLNVARVKNGGASAVTTYDANNIAIAADDGGLPFREIINHEGDHVIVNYNERVSNIAKPYANTKNENEILTEVANVNQTGSMYSNNCAYSGGASELNKGLDLATNKLKIDLHQTLSDDRFSNSVGVTADLFQKATGSSDSNIFQKFIHACSTRLEENLSFDERVKQEETIKFIEGLLK